MAKKDNEKLFRMIDANFNRAKEGLRVCEDVCRFALDDSKASAGFKKLRHDLSDGLTKMNYAEIIKARNINGDVGRKSTNGEYKRNEINDLFIANSQRVKESMRVLEETSKYVNKQSAEKFKKIRYQAYALEKRTLKKM